MNQLAMRFIASGYNRLASIRNNEKGVEGLGQILVGVGILVFVVLMVIGFVPSARTAVVNLFDKAIGQINNLTNTVNTTPTVS